MSAGLPRLPRHRMIEMNSTYTSRKLIGRATRLLPGIALCAAITIAAILLQVVEVHFAGQPYLEALVLAILLGVAIRAIWTPGQRWQPGIHFSAKFVLEIAIVMLGASVSVGTILALGPILIAGIAGIVCVAIGASYMICRAFGLPQRMSILIACGNSICGNSAIAAIAPVIGADGDDIASSISFTAVLGVLVVLGLPLLVPILHLSLTQYGVLAGLTVYAVPQVLAATLPIGALSNQVGTVIKLVRVLMLGPVVLGFSLLAVGLRPTQNQLKDQPNRRWPAVHELVPWFIVGFLVVLATRSFGLIPPTIQPGITQTAAVLTTVAMGALGLGVDVRVARTHWPERHGGGDGVAYRARPDELHPHSPDGHCLMQPKLAVDRPQLGRLDQLAVRDLHGMQRPFQLLLPEIQKLLQLGKFREKIVGLPDVRLQQPLMIGTPVQDVCGSQAKTVDLFTEVLRDRNHRALHSSRDTSFHFRH